MEWLFDIAREYGLFVALVVYVLYTNREREMRYITIIDTLSEDVKERLTKIEARLFNGREDQ